MTRVWTWVCVVAMAATAFGQGGSDRLTPETFKNLEFRTIGPSLTTGRISDIAVDPKNANVWYVAVSAGNLWKTENRGNTWTPIFETYGSYSLGAVVVDPKNSNVVWLATGENNNQRSVSYGDGIYKSTDAGATWTRMGLENSEHIQNVLIDPRDSNVVYVSAIGPLWNAGGDRGLYKTTDGGKTWKAVLTISPDTGVTDVVMDPVNPNVLYAAAYQRRRAVGQLVGGGPESALYKTTDGGAKWTKLTKGLPTVDIGRIGLGINWKNPKTVYALVTAQLGQGGFFRSDDAGASWTRIGRSAWLPPGGRRRGEPAADARALRRQRRPAACAALRRPRRLPSLAPRPRLRRRRRTRRRPGRRLLPRWRSGLLQRDLRRWTRPGNDLVAPDADVAEHGRRQDVVLGGDAERARRSPRDRLRSDRPQPRPSGQRRRAVRDLRRDEDVAALHEPAAVAVLPRQHRQRQAVLQRLRRHAGQRFDLRAVAHAQRPCRHPDERLVCRRRRRRVLHRQRPRRSEHRLRRVAGGELQPAGPAHGRARQHAPAADAVARAAPAGSGQAPSARLRAGRACGCRRSRSASGRAGAAAAGQGAPAGGGRGGRGAGGRWHWDTPIVVSPHVARRIYVAGDRVYRSDDRGDNWVAISADLTRNLDPAEIPIMGKVWPRDSVAFNQATTQLSTITALDESPLLADLIYIGTFDGLVQVTEDGGKTWRKVEKLPGLPEYTAVTDVAASTRDANTVYATFNNYQRGDFKPYVYKSTDRGRTWTSIAGNLPQRSGAWSIVQDHLNGDLMFAGMEFGVWFTVDGGAKWTQLKGGIPTTQARDLQIQRRESDLVVGTFGRGAYILDDYSALRGGDGAGADGRGAALSAPRRLHLRRAQSPDTAAWGNESTPNPPFGAVFTYHVGQAPAADAKLVLTIADDTGRPVRRLDLAKEPGLQRIAWNLRGEAPAAAVVAAAAAAAAPVAEVGRAPRGEEEQDEQPVFGGRGGPIAPLVAAGRYRATLGRMVGDIVTPIGEPQPFQVLPLPR